MNLTSTLITHPQGTAFTHINILQCTECSGYEVDMHQANKILTDDIHLFKENIPLFTANSICWDCYCSDL